MTLYDELASYTGRSLELVRVRGQYAAYELAWLWGNRQDRFQEFYTESDLYLYDLTEYQTRLHAAGWHTWLQHVIKTRDIRSVLDFGGGIGESTITCWNAGVRNIDFMDLAASQQFQYAQRRFKQREMKARCMDPLLPLIKEYDLIIAMDVLEHIQNPEPYLKRFAGMSPLLITNCDDIPYGELFPQHISHPDPKPWYTKDAGNLWRRKEDAR